MQCTQRLEVREKPTRALLDDLDLLDEELECIRTILQTQIQFIPDFVASYENEISNNNNNDDNKPGWTIKLQNFIKGLQDKDALFEELNNNTEKLRRQVIRQVDLEQDSNSKAILVFTIVTIIFLPLSFITSYLGMNTNDIRNMDLDQSIFWEVGGPFTAFVVAFCVLIAYRGSMIREAFVQIPWGRIMRHRRRKRQHFE
jgi:Mg2+ and Co2+ transporter CorA